MRRVAIPLALTAVMSSAMACSEVAENREPWCRDAPATILVAQSVPSADLVPCVRFLPDGWTFASFEASDAGATFAIAGPDEGDGTADVSVTASCADASGRTVRTDEPGTELLHEIRSEDPYRALWTYLAEGECVRVSIALPVDAEPDRDVLMLERALSFVPRSSLGPPA
jgi:hypothetical protein